jgi:DNA-binding LytR/AlgR family response regulator
LTAFSGHEIYRVKSSDIFYIETVENRSFIYCENAVYESRNKLYELEEMVSGTDFLRISKSVILNLSKVQKLIPALSGRFEAVLINDLKVIISRQYVSELKKRLEI